LDYLQRNMLVSVHDSYQYEKNLSKMEGFF
jgi:hypothetical protein